MNFFNFKQDDWKLAIEKNEDEQKRVRSQNRQNIYFQPFKGEQNFPIFSEIENV